MGVTLSALQQKAVTRFGAATPCPAAEIVPAIFDPLSNINWREVDFTIVECRESMESVIAHSSETCHIPLLFGHVAKLLDGVSTSIGSGGSSSSSSSQQQSQQVQQQQMTRVANLVRLASVLIFNVIQQCAGNPFVLLRLTNAPNEEAMTMLGAAAELIVRVPFSNLTAQLHVETTELVRFSFTTRLYGQSLAAAASGEQQHVERETTMNDQHHREENAAGGKSPAAAVGSSNTSNSTVVVRDPFLRRLALGQRDALLTKALVHALLQRVCVWAQMLRGVLRPTVWIAHQKAAHALHPVVAPSKSSLVAESSGSSSNSSSTSPTNTLPPSSSSSANYNNNTNNPPPAGGWGSKIYGWIFGGGQSQNASPSRGGASSSSGQPAGGHPSVSAGGGGGVPTFLPPSGLHAPYPSAGLSGSSTSAEILVGSSSLHLLLSLLFFERGSSSRARNAAVDVLRQLRGIDGGGGASSSSSASALPSSSSSSSPSPSSSSKSPSFSPIMGGEWPLELLEAIATLAPSHTEAVLLLYVLLNDCPSFSRSIAMSSSHGLHTQLTHLTVEMLRVAVERPSSPESLFTAVVVSMLARIDAVARCMFSQKLRNAPAYFVKESPFVTTSLSVGAFLILAIVKIVFRASMGDGQASIGAAWLSALANLSPFAVGLETAVEQKLASLFLALLRRVNRLRGEVKANENAFHSAAQLDVAYSHLDILSTAIFQMVADPQRNPTLLYELLYHREKLSAVTASWTEGDQLWRALKPIMFILGRIESELSSSSESSSGGPRSIASILEVIRSLGRTQRKQQESSSSAATSEEDQSKIRIQLVEASATNSRRQMQNNNNNNNNNNASSDLSAGGKNTAGDDDKKNNEQLRLPRITIVGKDEEIMQASYEFEEERFDGGRGGGGGGTDEQQQAGAGGNGVCEPFFATMLWYGVLHTDEKVEPPGCLRHGALGVSHHGELFPLFKNLTSPNVMGRN